MIVLPSGLSIPSEPQIVRATPNAHTHTCTERKNSAIEGTGTFATRDIKKGEKILDLTGQRKGLEAVLVDILTGRNPNDDPLQIGLQEYIILDEASKEINHSCNPNAGIRGESELIALREIKQGEEVTYDYSITGGRNITPDIWTMHDCKCGSPNCRGKVANILTIPPSQLEHYLSLDAIPDFNKYVAEGIVEGNKASHHPTTQGGLEGFLQQVFLQTQAKDDEAAVVGLEKLLAQVQGKEVGDLNLGTSA